MPKQQQQQHNNNDSRSNSLESQAEQQQRAEMDSATGQSSQQVCSFSTCASLSPFSWLWRRLGMADLVACD